MNRREFAQITLGVLATLAPPRPRAQRGSDPDPGYLERGLNAMARAGHWFDAHWGAAVIAGTYLCSDNDLGDDTRAAIREQLDVALDKRSDAFRPFADETPQEELVSTIAPSLEPALLGGLRAHGHAVIYTALALRALGDVPHMALPSVIEGVRRNNAAIARARPRKPDAEEGAYRDTQAMVESAFESLLRFEELVGRPAIRRPNFTHIVTHTEALARLDTMGYDELVTQGQLGHRAHLANAVPEAGREPAIDRTEVSLAEVLRPGFWQDPERQALWHVEWSRRGNPNGDWIASGHLFKVLYAFCELAKRIPDQAVLERCGTVLLERYFHPEVSGG